MQCICRRPPPSIAFITLTNSGYIEYTLNCIQSLINIRADVLLHCYCIGRKGHDILLDNGFWSTSIDTELNSNFQTYRRGNWSNITHNKFTIIHDNLLTHDYVCFTDGDIVFERKNFMSFLLRTIGKHDMLIQNDSMYDSDASNLCSGFMFIRSNPTTISLFDPWNTVEDKDSMGWDDQVYINEIKHRLNFKTLPLDLFPNGKYYFKNVAKIRPYLIHFNWLFGHSKRVQMEKYRKWYLPDQVSTILSE